MRARTQPQMTDKKTGKGACNHNFPPPPPTHRLGWLESHCMGMEGGADWHGIVMVMYIESRGQEGQGGRGRGGSHACLSLYLSAYFQYCTDRVLCSSPSHLLSPTSAKSYHRSPVRKLDILGPISPPPPQSGPRKFTCVESPVSITTIHSIIQVTTSQLPK